MKEFVVYTVLRLLLFVTTYAVFAGVWALGLGREGVLWLPFVMAVIVSSLLSLRLLAPQRERFAAVVERRAERATQRFDEIKAREDSRD